MTLEISTSILNRIAAALGSVDEKDEHFLDWFNWYDYKFAMALRAEGWKLLVLSAKEWEVIKMFRSWEQMPTRAPSSLVPDLWPRDTFIVPLDFHEDSIDEVIVNHPITKGGRPTVSKGRTIPTNGSHQTKKNRLRTPNKDRRQNRIAEQGTSTDRKK